MKYTLKRKLSCVQITMYWKKYERWGCTCTAVMCKKHLGFIANHKQQNHKQHNHKQQNYKKPQITNDNYRFVDVSMGTQPVLAGHNPERVRFTVIFCLNSFHRGRHNREDMSVIAGHKGQRARRDCYSKLCSRIFSKFYSYTWGNRHYGHNC